MWIAVKSKVCINPHMRLKVSLDADPETSHLKLTQFHSNPGKEFFILQKII